MQDQLGDLHDADVATGLIKEYIDSQSRHRKKSEKKSKKSDNPQSPTVDPQSATHNPQLDRPQSPVPPGLAAYLEERESAIRHIHADFFATWSRMQSPEWRTRLAAVIMA